MHFNQYRQSFFLKSLTAILATRDDKTKYYWNAAEKVFEMRTLALLLNNFPEFYGPEVFITVFTKTVILTYITPNFSLYVRKIHFNSVLPPTSRS